MQLVLPALTFRTPDGHIDAPATTAYAMRAARTWAYRFILSGTTTGGHQASETDRAAVVDLWADAIGVDRLTACCWTPADITHATDSGVVPMVVLRDLTSNAEALELFARLPKPSYLFSHPEFSPTTLTPELAATARAAEVLPAAAKVSKVPPAGIAALRSATGPSFALWDGTARHIAASLTAGADGIVTAPLSHLPHPFPRGDVAELQAAIDTAQHHLDTQGGRDARTSALFAMATARRPSDEV
ncbi:conserved hypothetical protein [Frankia canadensis]|uniref:Dihydrodipicolinate synthase/N-acetylneuraminate lyase n=1 Tax=Frankia canadensis TaxID=1836972 RepID=A0A2I2L174_9ACTN|nr:hypothetical protein [Frankia canadensis]SNQ51660.1 conserved hypothetical protein [Frankia canadensis]SOU58950.1 conserved hypothetical protein [Frankia canadensis]